MATLSFLAGSGTNLYGLSTSGIGFYGDNGFGYAVTVGEYNGTTYITNSNGTNQGPACDNIEYIHPNSGIYHTGVAVHLRGIPNQYATLNVRLTDSSSVSTQNTYLYIYDRNNRDNGPSGVTCQVAELIHPWTTPSPTGSGSVSWVTGNGSSAYLTLSNSPGLSGLISGAAVQHDWYIALSASPTSVGSKTQFGLWFQTEFI
jgi:hypothetical protein